MNCEEGKNAVNYDCKVPAVIYDLSFFQICYNIKIYIRFKINTGLITWNALLKSSRSLIFSLRPTGIFLSMGKIT